MRRNFSYTYLLPLLSEQVNLKKEILTNILDTYVITNKNSKLGKFYILCKFDYSTKDFARLEDIVISNDLYVTSYEINDKILYEFNFPKIYIHEQKSFINGKYSEYKDDSKKLVMEYWAQLYGHIPSFVNNTLLKIRQIFNKDEKLRIKMNKELKINIEKGSELGNKIEKENETFYFEEDKTEKVQLNNIKDVFN